MIVCVLICSECRGQVLHSVEVLPADHAERYVCLACGAVSHRKLR